jgi:18S rRNA (guanine1575-N7)-methyltransferase
MKRLKKFFESLYKCLVIGGRCCFQFYPDNPEQVDIITNAALRYGFSGGVIIDFPNSTKAKK